MNKILLVISSVLAAFVLGGCSHSVAAPDRQKLQYGVQLYTVRADMERDAGDTLRRIADIGFDEVEFAGLFGADPAETCRLVQELGMSVAGSQIDWRAFRDNADAAIAETIALCSPVMIFAWMPPEERQTLDQWRWWVGHINEVAQRASDAGIRFAYHAHDFEYEEIDGQRPIDLIIDGLDPRFADFELDTYWATKGGDDPLELIMRYPGRFPLLHIKDMSRTDETMVDVGDGRIDFPEIFKLARRQGTKHFLVEHDTARDPWLALKRSLSYLKRMDEKRPPNTLNQKEAR